MIIYIGFFSLREIKFAIDFILGTTSISIAPCHMAPTKLIELKVRYEHLERKGFTWPNVSPWGPPILFIQKKYGSMYLCIDCWKLDRAIIKHKYLLPRIVNLLNQLRGSRCFYKNDHWIGYHQFLIKEEKIAKTTFCTCHDHYEFLVMPFTTFMDLMNWVFYAYLNKFIILFIDNIIV